MRPLAHAPTAEFARYRSITAMRSGRHGHMDRVPIIA